MMTPAESLLDLLGSNPTLLHPAPETGHAAAITHRTEDEIHPCLRCGNRAKIALIAAAEESGPRWLDLCLDCYGWLLRSLPDSSEPYGGQ